MCGRSYVARKPGFGTRRGPWERHGGSGNFLGMEVAKMSSKARVAAALSVLVPVALSGLFLVAFFPGLWWIFTTYGWVAFPAFGLLSRGLSSRSSLENRTTHVSASDRERELLTALREHGEITPVRAATETSLTVAEADGMLKELAAAGHLEVRARHGGLFYALWGKKGAT